MKGARLPSRPPAGSGDFGRAASDAPPRVFMIEDDRDVVEVLGWNVKRLGWEFGHWATASGALDRMVEFRPDVVLLDVVFSDGSGFDLCASLRREAALAHVPVIFLTAKGDLEDRLRGFSLGAHDYVPKPFSLDEVKARLNVHVQAKRRVDALRSDHQEMALRERERDEMTVMLAHDMRSPISAIRMMIDALADSPLAGESDVARVVDAGSISVDLLLLMVNNILDVGTWRVTVSASPLDVSWVEKRLRGLFSLACRYSRITLDFNLSSELSGFSTDGMLVFRTLANLVSNALKFSPEGGAIEVTGRLAGERLRLEVADQGPGIPEAERERVFERYYRGAGSVRQGVPGIGIGLTFCRLACEALGGGIWLEDRAGGGSLFVIEVPPAAPGRREAR